MPTTQQDQDLAPEQAQETSTALVERPEGQHVLDRRPAIDLIPERMLKLLEAKSPNLTHAERGQALELAVAYQLDPFANEIWFAKGRGRNGAEGKLLIMVGRDGLRKIAQRNGLEVDGDAIRKNDVFRVTRGPDRERLITHEYEGDVEQRGELVGAWAECYERASGRQRGFFFAPIGEYRPGTSDYSPWAKQTSVMILAAAERQAVRQATPLGGLLVEGEDALVNERGDAREATAADDPLAALPKAARAVIERARRVGHVQLSDAATAQMVLAGQPDDFVARWVEEAGAELDRAEGAGAASEEAEAEPVDAEVVADGGEEDSPAARADALRERAVDVRAAAEASREAGDDVEATELDAEADSLEAEADAISDESQGSLL